MEKVFKPKIELPQKPQEPEIETWEDEGGVIETPEEEQVAETIVEELKVQRSWEELVLQAEEEFPEEIKTIIDKSRKEKLTPKETGALDGFSYHWFRETFGIKLKKKQETEEEVAEKKIDKKTKKTARKMVQQLSRLSELSAEKEERMKKLHESLISLDKGEPVQEFKDETRRIVYFDEENQRYFVEENGSRKIVDIGDIISDYAWNIKYVPDGEMVEPAYRIMAKRILANETRHDLETIHNLELMTQNPDKGSGSVFFPIFKIKEELASLNEEARDKKLSSVSGIIAEIAIREFLSRVAHNNNLDFVVSRATIQEDIEFKYDFKIRVKHYIRGIGVDGQHSNKLFGFQLKTKLSSEKVYKKKYPKGQNVGVDEVLILTVPGKEFVGIFKTWLKTGESSGGPEQFLSRDFKIELLKAVTKGLVDIKNEDIEKIFPKE